MSVFLPSAGGYRNLKAFQLSEIVYDPTMIFAKNFIRQGSRTRDRIEQAARSGKQNISEGSEASRTSKETEIKPTNVAKASLEELLLDYEDYLRQNNLSQRDSAHPRTLRLRTCLKSDSFMQSPTEYADRLNAEEYCNLCITLINQTTFLLRWLINRQEQQFPEQGGIKEQMYRARLNYRSGQEQTGRTGQTGTTSPTNGDTDDTDDTPSHH